jgi:hypothetical protein
MRVKFILILPTNLIDEFLSKDFTFIVSDRLPFLLCSSKISSIILKLLELSVMIKKDKKVKEKRFEYVYHLSYSRPCEGFYDFF